MKYIIATIFQLAVLFGLRHFTKEHPFDMVSYTLGVIGFASCTRLTIIHTKEQERRENEKAVIVSVFNEGYAKTGDINESLKHVWRAKKLM